MLRPWETKKKGVDLILKVVGIKQKRGQLNDSKKVTAADDDID